jgi:hypothetical protein
MLAIHLAGADEKTQAKDIKSSQDFARSFKENE